MSNDPLRQIQGAELSQTQSQRLILSPYMQQALQLLQLPILELSAVITTELEKNPLLELPGEEEDLTSYIEEKFRNQPIVQKREEEDLRAFAENTIALQASLYDLLMQQALDTFSSADDLHLAEILIGNIDSAGFLTTPLEELSALYDRPQEALSKVLEEIQTFDPPGVGARTLQESFLIQLRLQGKKESMAFQIIESHFEELIHNRLPAIAKQLKCSPQKVRHVLEEEISHLYFHPGTNYPQGHYQEVNQTIVPDVYVHQTETALSIEVNEQRLSSLRFNNYYLKLLEDESLAADTKKYLQEKISSGKWLLRNISERSHTLYRLTEKLLEKQAPFFQEPSGQLIPLTMKEIAEELELHESTIARAVSHKHLSCSKGVVPLRSFFTNALKAESGGNVSSSTVKELVKKIIREEDKSHPHSDAAISSLIEKQGITCARRTVTKYRLQHGFGNTAQRRQHS